MAAGAVREVRIILTGDSVGYVKSVTAAGAASEVAQTKMQRMQSVGRGMSSLGRSMATLAVPMLAVGGYAVKSAATFQDAMTLLRTQVGVSVGEMNNMSRAVNQLAPQVGEGPNALAAALYPIESVGLRGAAALSALKAAAIGAQISGASLTDTADAVSGALRTQMSDVHSASDAMSIMNGIVAQGKLHLTDLIAAMATGILPAAKVAGLGFRDVGAAIAAMTRQGIPAQTEATRLRLNLTQFEAPKAAALKALQSIGLGQFSLADDMRGPKGLIGALLDLRAHISGLSKDAQAQVLSTAFGGARGSANVAGLLNALPMMQQISGQLVGANAARLAQAFGLRAKDASFQWAKMKATVQAGMIGIGNALMPLVVKYLPKLVTFIKGAVQWFLHLPKPIKEIIVGLTLFLAVGGPILMLLGNLVTVIAAVGTALTFLAANPIILFIAAIVVAIVLLITHFKQVKMVANAVWSGITTAVRAMAHAVASVASTLFHVITWPFVQAYNLIRRVVHGIESVVSGIVGAGSSILSTVTFGALAGGGPVRRTHFDTGGPVGTDTIPGWLSPGEFVLNKATTARIGSGNLSSLNAGGGFGGGDITITPLPVILKISEKVIGETAVRWAIKKAARGPSSLTGGGMLTGGITP